MPAPLSMAEKFKMKHTIAFVAPDEETLEIHIDGENVGNFNHDDHGWNGMQAAQQLMRAVARKLNFEIIEAT